MTRKFIYILVFALFTQASVLNAGTTGSEELTGSGKSDTTKECFEGVSRAMFKLNHGLDKVIFEPVAKAYRTLPSPVRSGKDFPPFFILTRFFIAEPPPLFITRLTLFFIPIMSISPIRLSF